MCSDIVDPRLGEVNRRIPYAPVLTAVLDAETLAIATGRDDRELSPSGTAAVRTADIATARSRTLVGTDALTLEVPDRNPVRTDDDARRTIPGVLRRPTLRSDSATHYACRICGATHGGHHRACSRRGSERVATYDLPR